MRNFTLHDAVCTVPFDGSGNFNRDFPPGGWAGEASSGIKIRSDHHDTHDLDLANGLSNAICKDGQSQPTADITLNGHKLINVLNPAAPQDAATKDYVDNFRGFTTSITIGGADDKGRLVFSSLTGSNGIEWAGADLSWLARLPDLNKTVARLVLNNDSTGNAPGVDVTILDRVGNVNLNGSLTWNLSWDGDEWRTISPGYATRLNLTSSTMELSGLDAVTITSPYMPAALRSFFKVTGISGNSIVELFKTAASNVAGIVGGLAGKRRWLMYFGNQDAESGVERIGSNFKLYSYNNAGTTLVQDLDINRATHKWTLGGELYAPLVTSSQNFDSISTVCILSATAGGSIRLRPDGPTASGASETIFDTNGNISVSAAAQTAGGGVLAGKGVRDKAGLTGAYSTNHHNLYWDGTYMRVYTENSYLGAITWQCDYRFKKNIQALPSMWEKVKSLHPISFQQKAWGPFVDNDTVRWGFIAHELQEQLIESAASGHKDEEDVQSPDLLAVVAGLTRALQEAMLRIEALEASG